ncbi:hypothetical protein RTE01_42180 [Raoultella terrigena]|jgi:hypothetical protein|nr:hypothetical protein RTE01_42180 [Raoultella terrigena]VTM21903.1 Uncharacterised protein [Raoultella terrigena]
MCVFPGKHQYIWIDPHTAVRQDIKINGEFDPVVIDDQAKSTANSAFGILFRDK